MNIIINPAPSAGKKPFASQRPKSRFGSRKPDSGRPEARPDRRPSHRPANRPDSRQDMRSENTPEKFKMPMIPHKPSAPAEIKTIYMGKETAPIAQREGNFEGFNLPEMLNDAIEHLGFEQPTPIQARAIPIAMTGADLIGCAQTGTGKTLAFSLPMLTRLLENENEVALILAPTRELAMQIQDTIRSLTSRMREIRGALLLGGSSYFEQGKALARKPNVIVATPGRLVDHLQRRTVSLAKVKFLVLDEADRMLDMGFAPQLDRILQYVPKERQTLLFSATFAPEIKKMAQKFLRNPQEVFVGNSSRPAEGVEQQIVETTSNKKLDILLNELNKREGSVLIFTGTKHRADRLAKSLNEFGHSVDRIHGGRSMGQRKMALHSFREQHIRVLVATDIAARGLDISHVAHVINFDLPRDPEDYIHRIGRTARAGAKGQALSFIAPDEKDQWKKITRLLPK